MGARALLVCVLALSCAGAAAQEKDGAVTVTALRNPVDKSYRRMVAGMDRFERLRAQLAPAATLRFRLLPRHRATAMDDVEVHLVGDSFETPVEVAADRTFTLPRDAKALRENASVRPNRKAKTMTWRAEVRSPGVPAGARRLGDLRMECEVGMEAGLISNRPPGILGFLVERLGDTPEYCRQAAPRYLFFAERAIWSVTLEHGARREVLPSARLWAGATEDPEWKAALPYCDCEVMVERSYFMPLGDRSWPDDTLVRFEYMEER